MENKEFNTFLDSEIDNLRNEIQRPGWTTWALSGALAALVWILISLVEQGSYSVRAVAMLLLVIAFLDYSYAFIKNRISPSLPSQQTRGRLIPTRLLTANIPGLIIMVAQLVFLTIVIRRFSPEVGSVATRISLADVSILLLGALGTTVVVIARFPVPLDVRNRASTVMILIWSGSMLLAVWYHIRFLWISPGGATVYDVRFALVIAAIYYLSQKLVSVPGGAVTLDVLRTVRRELLLKRMELGTAIRQVDIALAGMRASDLLEGYVSKLLSLYRDASAELSKSASCIDQMDKSVSETAEKLSPELVPIKRQDMAMLTSSMEKAHTIITADIPRAYGPIGRRMTWLASQGFLEDSDDLKTLGEQLKAVQADLEEQGKQLEAKWVELRKTIGTDEAPRA